METLVTVGDPKENKGLEDLYEVYPCHLKSEYIERFMFNISFLIPIFSCFCIFSYSFLWDFTCNFFISGKQSYKCIHSIGIASIHLWFLFDPGEMRKSLPSTNLPRCHTVYVGKKKSWRWAVCYSTILLWKCNHVHNYHWRAAFFRYVQLIFKIFSIFN